MIIHGLRCQLAFIRLNKNTRWTYIDESIQQIQDVVYVEDKFYAIDHFNRLFCVEVAAEDQFNSYLVGEALEEPLSVKNRYLVDSSDHKELWFTGFCVTLVRHVLDAGQRNLKFLSLMLLSISG